MRQASIHLLVSITACIAFVLLLGSCQRKPLSTSTAEKSSPERSKFFTTLAAEPQSGALKSRFDPKFPTVTFQVGRAGPASLRPSDGGPGKHQVEVSLVVKNVTPKYNEDRLLILIELEKYLKELITSSGMELNGPVHETVKDGKKVGFWFGYKSATHSGALRVDPQEKVLGGTLITVAEDE